MERCSSNDQCEFPKKKKKKDSLIFSLNHYHKQDIEEALRTTNTKEIPTFSPLKILTKLWIPLVHPKTKTKKSRYYFFLSLMRYRPVIWGCKDIAHCSIQKSEYYYYTQIKRSRYTTEKMCAPAGRWTPIEEKLSLENLIINNTLHLFI